MTHVLPFIIIEGGETAFNDFWYQFTTGKSLKNMKLTLNYYENDSMHFSHENVCMYVYVCMYACMYVFMHGFMSICMACMYVCMYAYKRVCMYACIHVYVYESLSVTRK